MGEHIFVFGSNLAGRHGMGAAREARQTYGAEYGVGEGLTGRSYALPTKDHKLRTLPFNTLKRHVQKFLDFAADHPELTFQLTPIGCGLAGYKPEKIAPLFLSSPSNVQLPQEFKDVLGRR